MTASKSQFSIPRLPKALVATGLAAVLVGCGGGSSSTSKTGDEPTVTPAQQQAISQATTAYKTAKGIAETTVLSPTATPQEKLTALQSAEKAAMTLIKALEAAGDTSREQYKQVTADLAQGRTLIASYQTAVDGGKDTAAASKAAQTAATALSEAQKALTSATTPTQAQVDAVEAAISALQTAIDNPDLPASEKGPYETAISSAKTLASSKQKDIDKVKTAANNKKAGVWKKAIEDYKVATTVSTSNTDRTKITNLPSKVEKETLENLKVGPHRESLGNWVFTAARESD